MTSLEDKAEQADNEAYRVPEAAEASGRFRIESMELTSADEIGTDQFPQFGDWLPVTRVVDGLDHGECHLECPGALARSLIDAGAEVGTSFGVETASKNRDGEWTVEIETDDG